MSSISSEYVTLAAPYIRVGDVLHDSADYRVAVVDNPRRVVVADAYAAIAGDELHDITVRELHDGEAVILVEVDPRGR